nr:GAF domain-containing protein [uncultured Methanoregula sp.]
MPPGGESPEYGSLGVITITILLIIAIIGAGFFFYQSQERIVKDRITSELSSIAYLKADQIAAWRGERLEDAIVISKDQTLAERAEAVLVSSDPFNNKDILMRFGRINTSYPYRNVQLVSRNGRVYASLAPSEMAISPDLQLPLAESLSSRRAILTDLMLDNGDNSTSMYVIAPLILTNSSRDETIGAVILTIDPNIDLYPRVQGWPVPSKSAETLLVEREGDNVLFLNNLRHQNNTALSLKIPLSQTANPAVMAVRGTTGAFEGRDYRGVDVISVLTPVSGSPWFMVTKIDTAEAYSAWQASSGLILILIIGAVAGVFIVMGLLWQRRQKYYYRTLYTNEAVQRQNEQKRRQWMEVLLRLGEMDSAKDYEITGYVLEAACTLTESPVAFFGMLDPEERMFESTAWSKSIQKDHAGSASSGHLPIDQAGLWAEAVQSRRPAIVNDYATSLPIKNEIFTDSIPVFRFLSVPVFEGTRIVMVSTVANRESGYSATDAENLALLMQGAWNHIRKRRAEEALLQKTSDLEAAYEEITASDEELRSSYEDLANTQQALAESERKYRNLYLYAQVGLFETSFKDATVVACNQMYADLAGFSSVEDAIGKDILHLYVNPDERSHVSQILKEQGFIENCVVQFRNQSTGRIFWGQFSARYNHERDMAEGTLVDVTTEIEAKTALRESEQRLREAQEMAHLGFWSWDIKTGHVEWSDEVYRIFGLDPDVFTPEIDSVLALSPWPEDQQRDRELIRKAMDSCEPGTYEQRFLRPDKSIGYYHSTFQGRYDPTGNLVSIVGTVLDITQQKLAESEIIRMNETLLRQTKTLSILNRIITISNRVVDRPALLQTILDDTLDLMDYDAGGIYLIDKATQTASIACSKNLPPEFLASAETISILTPPYDSLFIKGIPIITNHYDRVFPANAEKTKFLSVANIPLSSKNEISGSLNVISKQRHIITENEKETLLSIARELGNTLRKMAAEEEMMKAEDALRKSEEKYRILFNRMVEGSALHEMIYDPSGNPADYRILDVNPAFEAIIGINRNAVIGKCSREAYGVETPPFLNTYARVAATGQPEVFEVYFAPMRKHFSISVYSPQAGRFATIFEDITDRKQAEQQREGLINELEKKNTELEQFTYTVSHDLKSPLITIKGFAGMVDEDARKGDLVQLEKDLSRITEAAETMQELLADLLELSRIGKIANPSQLIPFTRIAREAVDLLAVPLAERGVRVKIDPDLPVVNVDHARIREVLVNLIENAIKFSGNRKDPLIHIGAEYDRKKAVFFVKDNGIGINPRYLSRIFNLFERLEPSVQGTGIGLPITRRIIEAHGGKIWAESDGEGKGTIFRFTLEGTYIRNTDNNNNGQIKE